MELPINNINDRICELKKRISLLEWDLPHIKEGKIRSNKEIELKRYKDELTNLARCS